MKNSGLLSLKMKILKQQPLTIKAFFLLPIREPRGYMNPSSSLATSDIMSCE